MPKWTPETERDLLLSLYTATQSLLDKEIQNTIIANMKEKGHDDVNWDLLRYGCHLLAILLVCHFWCSVCALAAARINEPSPIPVSVSFFFFTSR